MKMIMAIIHHEDEMDTVRCLNEQNFFVTKLSTTGGFLKGKNTTIMIGTEDERVDDAVNVIRENAGKRRAIRYDNSGNLTGGSYTGINMPVPLEVEVGGCTIFEFPIDRIEKF
ncbi:cyclic-di-AMP receptor [Qiania dongpingensis]|uniref:Cyclic-di-AMP receptor n=1 Tax=Qiania dongpingensis TaxID=2763669 RepID=A0A7G9G346_9FIRM|nr:cyclic-di-AMP receptor [Qiania dongpingensis]QNM05228.1 cyclic-di-AMP receptor [Qiania dongpingensis]